MNALDSVKQHYPLIPSIFEFLTNAFPSVKECYPSICLEFASTSTLKKTLQNNMQEELEVLNSLYLVWGNIDIFCTFTNRNTRQ